MSYSSLYIIYIQFLFLESDTVLLLSLGVSHCFCSGLTFPRMIFLTTPTDQAVWCSADKKSTVSNFHLLFKVKEERMPERVHIKTQLASELWIGWQCPLTPAVCRCRCKVAISCQISLSSISALPNKQCISQQSHDKVGLTRHQSNASFSFQNVISLEFI